jgi:localization factor PodJL
MKFGVPWNVKGVRPEVRDSARQAARRSGMSVGEWLNHVIAERATTAPADHDDDFDAHDERDAERDRLTERIDRLDQRLGQILAKEPPAPAREIIYHADARAFTPPYPAPGYAPQPASSYAPPPPPQNGWANSIEQAVAEISARADCLDAPVAPPPAYNPPPAYAPPPAYNPQATYAPPSAASAPSPTYTPPPAAAAPTPASAHVAPPPPAPPRFPQQDISGLEGQLRNITEMIERLHQPQENEEIAALRKELAEISGKLNEAMPKHAIEALENEMRKIAGRLDESRQFGVDPAVIGNMERGLADVYQALRELKPAESLAGFEDAIRNLSFKIEQMGGVSHDPNFVQQLDSAIAALRGIVSHVASNEQLGALADEVRGLSAKIERVAAGAGASSPDFMAALDQKIGALTEQLKASGSPALSPRIESLLNSFSDRMERNELSSGEHYALGTLEDRIVSLAAKLDASDARLNQLGAIERGMAELLVHIQELRDGGASAAPRGNDIKREIAKEIAKTQDSLEAVHGTVDTVVDRLAILETERREPVVTRELIIEQPAPAAPPRAPMPQQDEAYPGPMSIIEPKLEPRSTLAAPEVTVTPPAKARPPMNRPRAPIDPNLPPDYPLEPGSGIPRERGTTAAERIAASEAALNGINSNGNGTASSGSTNFIAAARRAAQAAAPAGAPAAKAEPAKDEKPAEHKSIGQRVRSLLAGASVILLVAGGMKLAMNLFDSTDRIAELPAASPAQIANNGGDLSALIQDKTASIPTPRVMRIPDSAMPAPALSIKPEAEPDAQSDVTSSIGTAPLAPATEQPLPALSTDQRLVPPEKLPAPLRTAAINGDPAAAYEIAMRHLEGRGISQSLEEAARWLERSAKAGLAPAQFRLGSLYEKGQGVKKSLDTAQRLYSAAAQKGNAKAMHNLAVLYAEGAPGKPDYKVAAQWFRKAAERGIADSQYNLGILYARGIGVEQNLPEAYKWFSLASTQGDKEATKKRDDVGARLDAQSLMAARLAAQTFTVAPQPDEASVVKTPEGGWDRANNTAPKPAKKPRAIEPLKITPS